MTDHLEYRLSSVAMLCGVVAGLWLGLRRRSRLARRARSLLDAGRNCEGGSARIRRALGGLPGIRPPWLIPELLLVPLGLALGELTRSVVPLLGALAGVVPLRRWRQRRGSAGEARRRALAVIDLCGALTAELRSGATPEQALHAVTSRAGPSLARSLGTEPTARLAAARYGADVPAALRLAAELPGGRGAAAVAACWQVTAESGTGLAVGLDQVADALRAERALAEEIAGELAGPRTTIAVLAALPLVGLVLGGALGAKPLQVLLHTPAGLVCLLSGVVFEAVGLAWTVRIVRAAEDAPERRGWEASGGRVRGTPERVRTSARAGTVGRGKLRPGPGAGSYPWLGCGISRSRAHGGLRAEVAP